MQLTNIKPANLKIFSPNSYLKKNSDTSVPIIKKPITPQFEVKFLAPIKTQKPENLTLQKELIQKEVELNRKNIEFINEKIMPYEYFSDCKVLENLFLGNHIGFRSLEKDPQKFDVVIKLHRHDHIDPKSIYHVNVPKNVVLLDFSVTDIPAASDELFAKLPEIFKVIDDALAKNKKVLVFCYVGKSRSATVMIAYLMKRFNLDFQTAYNFVLLRRGLTRINKGFLGKLQEFEKKTIPQ